MHRRLVASMLLASPLLPAVAGAAPWSRPAMTLLTGPLELGGAWRGSAPEDAMAVLGRMRAACLSDVQLLSDRQPERLRVDDHASGPPYVWLHADNPATAWVIVSVGERDWCNLAYQFGHELGHVFANSWQLDAAPANPCQWLEEALVEAFSLRGLLRLAAEWERAPPFPNDGAYGREIRAYRERLLDQDRPAAPTQGGAPALATWFRTQRPFLESHGSVVDARGAVPLLADLLGGDASLVADLGALNRWPGRSGLALREYLARWRHSCAEIGTPGALPAKLEPILLARDGG